MKNNNNINNLSINNFKCAILDLDGTIIDSMPAWKNVTRDYLASLGITADSDIREQVKRKTSLENAHYLQSYYGVDKSDDEIIAGIHGVIAAAYRDTIPLKNSGAQILSWLRSQNIPFCAATSTDRDLMSSCLSRLGILDEFEFILTCSEVGKGKYHPDIFLQAMERMGGTLTDTVVFEDALHCVKTAHDAGFFVVGVYEEVDAQDWEEVCKYCDEQII